MGGPKGAKSLLKALPPLNGRVIETSIHSIYTTDILNPHLDLSSHSAQAKKIFEKCVPRYCEPSLFKHQLPKTGTPELAFIGRSNVGKSSLISALLGTKKLVRTSKDPGCTRSVNYYTMDRGNGSNLDHHLLYFVDLPGYGFAKQSKEDKRKWADMIKDYFTYRDQDILRRVFVLIDARHGMKEVDLEMMSQLTGARIPYQIILTKVDLVPTHQRSIVNTQVMSAIMSKYGLTCLPFLISTSAVSQEGIDALKLTLTEIVSHKWIVGANTNSGNSGGDLE